MDAARIEALVPELYRLVAELEDAAPGRFFAPDGHLHGSIGEVLAAARYELTLTTACTRGKDATTPDGREVEIKTTAGKVIALRGDPPRHLLVLFLGKDSTSETMFNGPGWIVWEQAGKSNNRNGQRQISLALLRQLQGLVPYGETLLAVEGAPPAEWECGTTGMLEAATHLDAEAIPCHLPADAQPADRSGDVASMAASRTKKCALEQVDAEKPGRMLENDNRSSSSPP